MISGNAQAPLIVPAVTVAKTVYVCVMCLVTIRVARRDNNALTIRALPPNYAMTVCVRTACASPPASVGVILIVIVSISVSLMIMINLEFARQHLIKHKEVEQTAFFGHREILIGIRGKISAIV